MDSDSNKSCYQKAIRILARRDHSCAELRKKLQSRGFEAPAIESVIRECERLNYLDDNRFAEAYVDQLQRKGFGIFSIEHKLHSKGIPETVFKDKLAPHGTDNAQLRLCRSVLSKKMRRSAGENPSEDQAPKLYRYLLNRGFPSHIIRQTIYEMVPEWGKKDVKRNNA